MNVMTKTFVIAAALIGLSGLASTANAQLRLLPAPHIHETPRLGIVGHFHFSHGMEVESVVYGSAAYRMGLEPGDNIRSINGRWLRTEADYFRALEHSHGYVRLLVEDVHTGALVSRSAYLGGYDHHHHHSARPVISLRPGILIP